MVSRRSQAYADGVQKFTWTLTEVTPGRVRCRCDSHPHIEGWGDSDQEALIDARTKVTELNEKAEIGTDAKA